MRRLRRPSAWLALLLLVLLSPLFLLVALAVVLGIGRPILFRQARSGMGGRSFRMVKFRTMRDAVDVEGRPLPDAMRTPPLGRLLRRSRLDELPELVNILRGEMTLVGPRPLLPETIGSWGVRGMIRGSVRPGLTGLSQVSGNTLLTQEEKLVLDLWYIRHRSPRLDLEIVVRTLVMICLGERKTGWHDEGRADARGPDRRG